MDRETKILKKLSGIMKEHPSKNFVAQQYDSGDSPEGYHYSVQEYGDGGSLSQYIKNRTALEKSSEIWLPIFKRLMEIVKFLHENGRHRSKLQNFTVCYPYLYPFPKKLSFDFLFSKRQYHIFVGEWIWD